VVDLGDLRRHSELLVADKKLYITDFAEILIYNLKTFKLINKFGKKGVGPREFRQYAGVHTQIEKPKTYLSYKEIVTKRKGLKKIQITHQVY
jgi:hypothetical protein